MLENTEPQATRPDGGPSHKWRPKFSRELYRQAVEAVKRRQLAENPPPPQPVEPELPPDPIAWGYVRVSSFNQTELASADPVGSAALERELQNRTVPQELRSISMRGQADRIEGYYKYALQKLGVLWGGIEGDLAVSAYKIDFQDRPAGGKLYHKLRRGDYLLLDNLDRLTRRLTDQIRLIQELQERGVRIVFCGVGGMDIDIETPMGQLFLNIWGCLNQWYSDNLSWRIKAAVKRCRKEGRGMGWQARLGTRWVYKKLSNGKRIRQEVWHRTRRMAMKRLVKLVDIDKMRMPAAARQIEAELDVANPDKCFRDYDLWNSLPQVHKWYRAEKLYQIHGVREPRDIDTGAWIREGTYFTVRQLIAMGPVPDPDSVLASAEEELVSTS